MISRAVSLLSQRNALVVRVAVGMSALWLLGGNPANATDQGLTGKKLLLKSTPKLVLLSKDASISIAGSDPINGADSSVSFDAGGGPVTFTLPKALWSTNGEGTLFKYKNADAPGGPSVVKVAKVKPGLLKVVAKGLPFPVPNGAATIDVVLSLDGGTNTYCLTFSGMGDGTKFLVKDALAGSCGPPGPTATPVPTSTSAPTTTPTTGPCTGELVGGFCWYRGSEFTEQSCDDVCAAEGKTCDPATETYAGSGGSLANCAAVLSALLGGSPLVTDTDCSSLSGLGCTTIVGFPVLIIHRRCTAPATTCDASHLDPAFFAIRACACK